MKLSFARNRLNALLRTQAFGAVGSLVPRITDMFVSGSVVGVDALAGAVCAAGLIAFAPQVVAALGIPRGEIFGSAVSALRICAFGLPFSVLMAFLISHLLAVNRVALSFAGTLLEQFVLTTGCAVALCGLWGVDLLWAGMPLGAVLSLMAIAAFCRLRDGTAIPEPAFEKGKAILNVSSRPAPERIVEMRNEVEAFLSAHGVSRETVGRVALLAEEYLNTIGCNRAMFTFAPDQISTVTHTPKERTIQPCN